MLDRTLAAGLSLWFPARDVAIGNALRSAGEFARPEVDLLVALHKAVPHKTFVDVGANIGAIGLPVAAALPSSPVLMCEANPAIHAILCANVCENRMPNVRPVHCVVGEREDVVAFSSPTLDQAVNFGAIGRSTAAAPTKVLMLTLDSLRRGPIGTLKIDVEGFEAQVLAGAAETIRQDRPAILYEAKPGEPTRRNFHHLSEQGYRQYWFFAPFVTPLNSKGYTPPKNIVGDNNILALPENRELPWPLPRIDDPDEDWHPRVREMSFLPRYGFALPG